MGSRILAALGLATWVVVGALGLARVGAGSGLVYAEWHWWAAFLGFGVSFLGAAVPGLAARSHQMRRALLAAQTLTALMLVWAGPADVTAILLVVVAAQAANAVSFGVGVGWVVAQVLLSGLLLWSGSGLAAALPLAGAFALFQAFAYTTTRLMQIEAVGREALARAHAELVTTQTLLARATRLLERQRISRELHDALGHHLTALSLHLEALRVEHGTPTPVALARAQHVTRLLLRDLRDTVAELRREEPLPLGQAVETLARGIEGLDVHVACDGADAAVEPDKAHALFRCTQELVTNVLRHAQARQLWLTVGGDAATLRIEVRDDGIGTDAARLAQGLASVRERLSPYHGRLTVETAPGRGCTVAIDVPRGTPA